MNETNTIYRKKLFANNNIFINREMLLLSHPFPGSVHGLLTIRMNEASKKLEYLVVIIMYVVRQKIFIDYKSHKITDSRSFCDPLLLPSSFG